jgi:paraquat-inducible protein B
VRQLLNSVQDARAQLAGVEQRLARAEQLLASQAAATQGRQAALLPLEAACLREQKEILARAAQAQSLGTR